MSMESSCDCHCVFIHISPTHWLCEEVPLFFSRFHSFLFFSVLLALISGHNNTDESQKEDLQLPLLELTTIEKATDNFSINNKLGQGGFGPVYKVIII